MTAHKYLNYFFTGKLGWTKNTKPTKNHYKPSHKILKLQRKILLDTRTYINPLKPYKIKACYAIPLVVLKHTAHEHLHPCYDYATV